MTNKEAIKSLTHCIVENLCEDGKYDLCDGCHYRAALDKAIEALSAERTGHWIEGQTAGQRFVKCSRCGHIEFDVTPNYCEDCGARMVEGEEK